jgi:penicillin-binding protein 1A
MAKKTSANKKKEKTRIATKRLVRWFWLVLFLPLLGLGGMLFLATFSDLPDISELENPTSHLATEVLSVDGQVLGQYFRENRVPVRFDELSPDLVNALVATEDERFYSHSGIDFRGTVRAVAYMGKKGGASTVTQQLAKMQFHDRDRNNLFKTIFQKFQEWVIGAQLERLYTKDEIIAMYLNRFDWINQAVGIRSAASIYFGTTPDELKTEQAALLVGMLKNPSLYNPLKRPENAEKRRMVVLHQMLKQEFISETAYDSLKILPLGLKFKRIDHKEGLAPYFRETLRLQLTELLQQTDDDGNYIISKPDGSSYDLYSDGLKIHTTIDSRMQEYAENAVQTHLSRNLQNQFFNRLQRKKQNPFSSDLSKKEVENIMNSARKRSDRYKILTGKMCGNCERPAAYIKEVKLDGRTYFECLEKKGGCSHQRLKPEEAEIEEIFDTPVEMQVFSWKGMVDTTFSPNDSIRYYKSFLQSGVLSMDPHTGYVKAWVGGVDFKNFQYDHVGTARRQVGSTFKPFVYATALREGMDPCMLLPNQPVCFDMPEGQEQWCPKGGPYGGVVTLKYALANSMNPITAWLMKQYGPEAVTKLARDMGIKNKLDPVPSLCLGVADLTLKEMTGAFAAFANKGVHIEPIIFTHIDDKNGNTIYSVIPETYEALDEVSAYRTLELLKAVVDGAKNPTTGKVSSTGGRLRQSWGEREHYGNLTTPIAGKTGTTQNNSDGWFIGITPDLVTGVWVGAEDRSVRFDDTSLGQGANMALPIFGYFMNKVYKDEEIRISKKDFERPEELESEPDCDEKQDQDVNTEPDWG